MTESSRHRNAVTFLGVIAKGLGAKIRTNDSGPYGLHGWRFPLQMVRGKPKSYIADLLIAYAKHLIDIEVDWKKGHSSKHNAQHDKERDDFLKSQYYIPTIRYNLEWVKGITSDQMRADIDDAIDNLA